MQIFIPALSGSTVSSDTTDNTTVRTLTPPDGSRAFVVSVKSKGIYLTLDGSTPAAGNGLFFASDLSPSFMPIMPSETFGVKWISSDVAGSNVDILWLR